MDVFTPNGAQGAGAGNASFLMMQGLLKVLEEKGVLTPSEINNLLTDAIAQVPSVPNSIKNDTRQLLQSLIRPE